MDRESLNCRWILPEMPFPPVPGIQEMSVFSQQKLRSTNNRMTPDDVYLSLASSFKINDNDKWALSSTTAANEWQCWQWIQFDPHGWQHPEAGYRQPECSRQNASPTHWHVIKTVTATATCNHVSAKAVENFWCAQQWQYQQHTAGRMQFSFQV